MQLNVEKNGGSMRKLKRTGVQMGTRPYAKPHYELDKY